MNTNPNAKRVLVYGDSFTFGRLTGLGRFPSNVRFTGILQDILGPDYEVIEEWLRGRMLDGENIFFPHRNGSQQFDGILGSHMKLDLVVIFLWTNDCNAGAHKSEGDFISWLDKYHDSLLFRSKFFTMEVPNVLLVCPPLVNELYLPELFQKLFVWAEDKLKQMPEIYKKYAESHDRWYLNAGEYVKAGKEDGIHIDAEGHRVLAIEIAKQINLKL